MKIVSNKLYKGIWPESKEDETIFLSNEEMLEHPEIMREAEVINAHPYILTKEFLDSCESVKWIQTPAAGVDSADLSEISKRGIIFTNGSGNMSISIAEDAFCKMLFYSRRVAEYEKAKREKNWITFDQDPWLAVVAKDLYSKRIGLIGDGAIAKEIGRRAKAFGMQVVVYGMYNKDCEYWDEFYDNPEGLDSLYATCDYIIVVVPLTKNTHHMIDLRAFEKMKNTAIFLNAARGAIVNQKDLVTALKKGEIAAAALDVFEIEPLPVDSELWNLENVFITTHKAGAGDSWIARLKQLYTDNMRAYKMNEPMRNVVQLR